MPSQIPLFHQSQYVLIHGEATKIGEGEARDDVERDEEPAHLQWGWDEFAVDIDHRKAPGAGEEYPGDV